MHKLLSYGYIYLVPLFLSAIFSLKSFGLKWPRAYRIFSAYLFITLFTEVFAISWKWYLHKTDYWDYPKYNLWIYNLMHIIRFGTFVIFYYKMLKTSPLRKIILYGGFLLVGFGIAEYFFIQSPNVMNNYTLVFTNVSCVLISLEFIRQVLRDNAIITLYRHPMVWISLGSFIYYSGSLPFFIFFNYLFREHQVMAASLMNINYILNIIMYTLYSIAFLCKPHFQK